MTTAVREHPHGTDPVGCIDSDNREPIAETAKRIGTGLSVKQTIRHARAGLLFAERNAAGRWYSSPAAATIFNRGDLHEQAIQQE